MKLKIKRNGISWNQISFLLFCLVIFSKGYGDAMISNHLPVRGIDDIKYYVMILVTGFNLIMFRSRYRRRGIFDPDLYRFGLWIFSWLFITLLAQLFINNRSGVAWDRWILLILPFTYCYTMLYTITQEEIARYMKAALLIAFVCYLVFEVGVEAFNAQNFGLISYVDSYSPFESSYAAGSSIMTSAFFGYYFRKTGKAKGYLYLSILFALLTFKRLAIIMAIVFWAAPKVMDINRKVKKSTLFLHGFSFLAISWILKYILHPSHIRGISDWFNRVFDMELDKFLMGRLKLYRMLINSGFRTAGYGSGELWMKQVFGKSNGIELEMVQLLLEVGVIGVAVFLAFCIGFTGRNIYALIVMDYVLFNTVTSSSLGNPVSWILLYLTIGYIRLDDHTKEGANPEIMRRKGQWRHWWKSIIR